MPLARIEPAIPAIKRLRTYAIDRTENRYRPTIKIIHDQLQYSYTYFVVRVVEVKSGNESTNFTRMSNYVKNEHRKEIMGVKEKPDIINIIERKRLQWYGHDKRIQEKRLPKLIMEWIPGERRKRGRPRNTWMEGVRAAMKTRHLEADQWLNRKEWCLGPGRRRQLSQEQKDRKKDRYIINNTFLCT